MQIALAIFVNTDGLRQGGSRTLSPRCFSSFMMENTVVPSKTRSQPGGSGLLCGQKCHSTMSFFLLKLSPHLPFFSREIEQQVLR